MGRRMDTRATSGLLCLNLFAVVILVIAIFSPRDRSSPCADCTHFVSVLQARVSELQRQSDLCKAGANRPRSVSPPALESDSMLAQMSSLPMPGTHVAVPSCACRQGG